MSDGNALYNAIVANPDDDTPRLVYADWIAGDSDWDNAEEKAVWLREQVQTNGELQRQFFHDEKPMPPWMSVFGFLTDYRYRRGFVEEVEVELLKYIIGPDGYPTTEAIGIARRFPIRKWKLSRYGSWSSPLNTGGDEDICELFRFDNGNVTATSFGMVVEYTPKVTRNESMMIRSPVCPELIKLIMDHHLIRGSITLEYDCVRISYIRDRLANQEFNQPPLMDILGTCLAKWVRKYAFPEDVK